MKEDVKEIKNETSNETTIINTDVGVKNGQDKCPKCGSTDISLDIKSGMLRCEFCRHEFESSIINGEEDLHNLTNEIIGSGAKNIDKDMSNIITLKCSSCGAEVVIDTSSVVSARCHWCRNTLSINEQIPNGAIPDMVLPIKITKEEAQEEIKKFVNKRKFFANPKFTQEFTTENIMGVYLPYMVIDVNAHSKLVGRGEKLVRQYTVKKGDNTYTRYDADVYDISREFDILVDDLTIESNIDKLNNSASNKTNNVINAVMPFDTENCVKFNANYLRGFSSEKRDINIEELKPLVNLQVKDIARYKANSLITTYNRGVRWDNETLDVKGEKWLSSYLPIWLYSYLEIKGEKQILHYVAVNARSKKTMGSIPIHMPKLMITSLFVELLGVLGFVSIDFDYNYVFLLTGIVYFFIIYSRYRNQGARHKHEQDTKSNIENAIKEDKYVRRETGLSNSHMIGANNRSINGSTNSLNITDLLNGSAKPDEYVKSKLKDIEKIDRDKSSE